MFKIDKKALELARKQFCLDIGLPWEEYLSHPEKKSFIRKAKYRPGTMLVDTEGARVYEGRDDFFHACICLGQLFLVVDEQIYDWAVEQYSNGRPEWFCEYGNLRKVEEKLREFGHSICDTHVYMLPENMTTGQEGAMPENMTGHTSDKAYVLQWYEQEEILNFREGNRFTSAICFSATQPDMLAVAALREEPLYNAAEEAEVAHAAVEENGQKRKTFDQADMLGMAGVSADGKYLWQIGINVDEDAKQKGLATALVTAMKEEVIRRGKVPFYGTSESHTISQTVGLKAGFVPAWTEVYCKKQQPGL